ncbi:MAG: undecaprenyl-diphosphate phosphatase [Pedosphaera sp.]|nr:undecaprenyl-diphosphate phosphatase [Pedosphaera sp.]
MPDWIAVIILGIIEGVTEFLPVSSTGHLQLAERWLKPQSELFDIVVQCGAVLAVLVVFQKRVRGLLQEWKSPETRDYLAKLAVAFALTVGGVLAAEKFGLKIRKEDVAENAWAVRVAIATLLGGILFLVIEGWLRNKPGRNEISWAAVIVVGVAQIIAATYSGSSRSGTTILFALALGVARPAATEFSFLLGVPTLLAAGGYKLFKAWKHHELAGENWGLTLLATVVAGVMAFLAVKWLLRYVQSHTFTVFGWYRIGLGILILAFCWR